MTNTTCNCGQTTGHTWTENCEERCGCGQTELHQWTQACENEARVFGSAFPGYVFENDRRTGNLPSQEELWRTAL